MEPGKYYHLYTHAIGFDNLFISEENYLFFLERYARYAVPVVETYAYCLMPNHFHVLVRIKNTDEVERVRESVRRLQDSTLTLRWSETLEGLDKFVVQQFSHLLNSYTQVYNKMYKRRGALFNHSFRCNEIKEDGYFTAAVFYIHNNPVHHRFVSVMENWTWSSYLPMLTKELPWLDQKAVIDWFGGKEQYLKYHKQPFDGFKPTGSLRP